MHIRTLLAASVLAATATTANAAAQTCTGIVGDDPARMYDFKIGDWEIHWRNRNGQGGFVEFTARGHMYASFDGDILIDEQRSDYFKGLTFRTYDPSEESWIVRWLPANSSFDFPISARLEDCVPVERHRQLAPDGREVAVVTRFEEITENRFVFRQDWSFDDGETWIEDVLSYEAIRHEND